MAIEAFPPVDTADDYGLLAVGGDVEVPSLLLAYRQGIFPWSTYSDMLTWFAPPERALLFLEDVHFSKSFKKFLKTQPYHIRINTNFAGVITKCQEVVNRGAQDGTWITDEIVQGYTALFEAGHAYSIEAYLNDDLVGGLYGVHIHGMLAGESMFYRKPNASKVCLAFLVERMKQLSIPWLDCQVMTDNLKSFGAREVARDAFMELLKEQLSRKVDLFKKSEDIGVWIPSSP